MTAYRIAHSGITWGYTAETADVAVQDVAELDYAAYETIGNIIEEYEQQNADGFKRLLQRYDIPLAGVYCTAQFYDAADADEDVRKIMRSAQRGSQLGATVLILAAGSRKAGTYTQDAQWRAMAKVFDEIARRAVDLDLITVIHPHTGTLIEKRTEIDAILDAVNPNLVFFGPDTGQIAKAGDDAIETVRTYKEQIRHVHLKDYGGGNTSGYAGYAPIGSGVIDMPAVFQILDEVGFDDWVTVELDSSPQDPRPPREAAAMSKEYLSELLGARAEWRTTGTAGKSE